MQVKTIKAHENGYGKDYKKKKGSTYEHPEPSALIKQKFVEEVPNDNDASKNAGLPGDGGAIVPAKGSDSEEHNSPSNDLSSGAGKSKSKSSRS